MSICFNGRLSFAWQPVKKPKSICLGFRLIEKSFKIKLLEFCVLFLDVRFIRKRIQVQLQNFKKYNLILKFYYVRH